MNDETKPGLLVVLSAPSGCGKDTVLAQLIKKDYQIKRSVSMTTRQRRAEETDGTDYYFVSREYFEDKLKEGQIVEHTLYNNNYYGTPKVMIDEWLANGDTVFLKIEVEGAGNIKRLYPESVSIFLAPPAMKTLEKRLRGRSSDAEEEIQSRLTIAENEMKLAKNYDYLVINDDLDSAVEDIRAIIRAERLCMARSKNKISEVINNA